MTTREATERIESAATHAGLDLDADASVARVNKALRLAGFAEKLTAGRGYYYYRDGNGIRWNSTYIFRASDASLRWWIAEIVLNIAEFGTAQ